MYLLTKRAGQIGKYLARGRGVWTKHSEVRGPWTTQFLVLKIPRFTQSLPLLYGYLSITDSSLGPTDTKIQTIPTSITQTPLYYGQFFWSWRY